MNYIEHLNNLKKLSDTEKEKRIDNLIKTSPLQLWPAGMPASVDPKLVLVGVSPGNSPMSDKKVIPANKNNFISTPCIIKSDNSNFYYEDTKKYWEKLRYLTHKFFSNHAIGITENESISLTTHFNLGTGSAGKATKKNVEQMIVHWVSQLLNEVHTPDLVILFGLNGILKDKDVSKWWNHDSGLKITWAKPDNTFEFKYNKSISKPISYKYREWYVKNNNNHDIRVVIWPNHPSRPPFSNMDIWKQSIDYYVHEGYQINSTVAK